MKLYHGSSVGGIIELLPSLSNHGKEYAYLTNSRVLAILYAHNPIKRPGGFFTYRFNKDGKLLYDEYFPNQTAVMYKGRKGYVYAVQAEDGEYQKLEKMPWVYLSEKAVKIDAVTEIDDLYEALLQEEAAGNLVINRHENMSEEEKTKWHAVVEKDVENRGLKSKDDGDYAAFIHEHFPEII